MNDSITFFIPVMDCPAEEAVIRRKLGTMPGVVDLRFDLIGHQLTIVHDGLDAERLRQALSAIGMTPADDRSVASGMESSGCGACACSTSVTKVDLPLWRQYGLFVLSGVLAILCEALYFAGVDETSWPIVTLAVTSMLLGGRETFYKGWIALKTFTLNINFLMCVAVVGGAVIGAWPEIALVVFLFGLAELIEKKALDRARNAVKSLMAMTPDVATIKQPDGSWQTVGVDAITAGAVVRVRPGERLPLDGVVLAGTSSVNQAPVTGESVPVDKIAGDKVFAGTINESGVLEFEATGGKDQTTLARIIRTVQEAQASRAPTQRFVDGFARVYTPIVCVLAMLVAVVPWLIFNEPFWPWLYKAMVLLVIACPCALVISTPVTVVSGLAAAARRGILIKGGVHLENGRKLKIIALDKTGTITQGKPRVTDVQPLDGVTRDDLVQLAASLDALSQHPIAQAVVAEWKGTHEDVVDFKSLTGRGVEGVVRGESCFVGNHRLAEERGVCSPVLESLLQQYEQQGKTAVVVARGNRVLGVIAVADTPRDSSIEALRDLHALKIRTLMLSGDNQTTADAIARAVGIDVAKGGMLPEDKLAEIEQLTHEHGQAVGMVGDGVNDAPALAKASIGFAMGAAGTDTALETADVALMQDDLRGLPEFIRLSRRTSAVLMQNITMALGFKAVFFVLAVAGMATMWMAVIADVGATLLVVANGLRLMGTQRNPSVG